jgi:hypothetical protein
MKRLALTLTTCAALCLAVPAYANGNGNNNGANQDHTCQGGHNCNGGSSSSITNSGNITNTATATGGSASSDSSSSSSSSSSAAGGAGGSASSSTSVNSSVNIDSAASSAYAPPLTSSNDTCMGSSSVGGQGVGFGLSLGTTWEDEDCRRRKNARFMYNMGQDHLAIAMMCKDSEVYDAIAAVGTAAQKDICKKAVGGSDDEPYTASRSSRTVKKRSQYNFNE